MASLRKFTTSLTDYEPLATFNDWQNVRFNIRTSGYLLMVRPLRIMCKGTWVCFKCRTAVRRDTWRLVTHKNPSLIGGVGAGRVLCPHCCSTCQFLGPSIAIPPKRNLQNWKRLESNIVHFRLDEVERSKKDST